MIINGLTSKYAIILYELAKDYIGVGGKELTIEEFKKIFGIENKKAYKVFANIKSRILEPAVSELNKNKNINFRIKYKLKKTGKKYSSIVFIIEEKQKEIKKEIKKETQKDNNKYKKKKIKI